MDSLCGRTVEHRAAMTVTDGLGKPSRSDCIAYGVIIDGGTGDESVEILRELLRLQKDSLSTFRIASYVSVLDRLAVVVGRNGFGDQRNDMIAAPTKVLL